MVVLGRRTLNFGESRDYPKAKTGLNGILRAWDQLKGRGNEFLKRGWKKVEISC